MLVPGLAGSFIQESLHGGTGNTPALFSGSITYNMEGTIVLQTPSGSCTPAEASHLKISVTRPGYSSDRSHNTRSFCESPSGCFNQSELFTYWTSTEMTLTKYRSYKYIDHKPAFPSTHSILNLHHAHAEPPLEMQCQADEHDALLSSRRSLFPVVTKVPYRSRIFFCIFNLCPPCRRLRYLSLEAWTDPYKLS